MGRRIGVLENPFLGVDALLLFLCFFFLFFHVDLFSFRSLSRSVLFLSYRFCLFLPSIFSSCPCHLLCHVFSPSIHSSSYIPICYSVLSNVYSELNQLIWFFFCFVSNSRWNIGSEIRVFSNLI